VIRIAITEAALVVIGKILPEGTVLQVDRRGGQCFIHLDDAIVNRLAAMRRPEETYSDVIQRTVEAQSMSAIDNVVKNPRYSYAQLKRNDRPK
jgi:hypothetical protein